MKKYMIALVALGMLTACGNNETFEDELVEVEVEENQPDTNSPETVKTEQEKSAVPEEYRELPEYQTITEQVGTQYTFETVTDNDGNRVLMLTDENGEKQYKTIFVKRENRLEIIHMNGDGGKVFEGEI